MSGMGERLIGMGKYRKSRAFSPEGFFECEGRGLKWLGEAQSQGGPRVVDVYDWGKDYLDIERVNACGPTIQAARDFGVALAHMHDAGAEHFGSAPTGYDGTCYFGPLQDPVPMDTGAWDDVATYLADGRLRPMVRLGMKRRELTDYDMELTEAVIDALPDILGKAANDKPARVHGDLWSGNVMWTPEGAVLIDPAAQGGHAEEDLAALAVFGCPHYERILAAYNEASPLEDGWRERACLHQMHIIMIHCAVFGRSYVPEAMAIARRYA